MSHFRLIGFSNLYGKIFEKRVFLVDGNWSRRGPI